MVNWNEGSNHNPIDPQAVKIGAEQEDFHGVKPRDEFRFLISRPWAALGWLSSSLHRLFSRRQSEGDVS